MTGYGEEFFDFDRAFKKTLVTPQKVSGIPVPAKKLSAQNKTGRTPRPARDTLER